MDVRLFFYALGRLCRERTNDTSHYTGRECEYCPVFDYCNTHPYGMKPESTIRITVRLLEENEADLEETHPTSDAEIGVEEFHDALAHFCHSNLVTKNWRIFCDYRVCPAWPFCTLAPAGKPAEALDNIIRLLQDHGELEHPQHTNTEAPTHSRHCSAEEPPGLTE